MENTSLPLSIDVEYLQGIHVVDSILWLDTFRKTDLCFLSHAATGSIEAHSKVLLTKTTATLLQHGKRKSKMLICPYNQRFSLGELDIEIFPSGYMPGSAQIRITKDQNSLVYTGPFRLENPITKQDTPVLDCDILIIRSDYGPEVDQSGGINYKEKILTWIRQQLTAGLRPVMYTDSLALSLQIIFLLAQKGIEVSLPVSFYRLFKKIAELKSKRCVIRRLESKSKNLCPITMPIGTRPAKVIGQYKNISTANIFSLPDSNFINSSCKTDASFFMPIAAGFNEQLHYTRESKASKIYVTGSAADVFATKLRSLGLNAWSLRPPAQLNLFAPTTSFSKPNEWFP